MSLSTALQRMTLIAVEAAQTVSCQFNPSELTISRGVYWDRPASRTSMVAPPAEYTQMMAATISMRLLFDKSSEPPYDVSGDVDTLMDWAKPTLLSVVMDKPQPPTVIIQWGLKNYLGAVVLREVSATYTLFTPDGLPSRALVNVTFEQISINPANQNPTSGGIPGQRSTVCVEGDSLHSIAFREYGSASMWRGIAAANGIDDPMRLEPGRTLLLPPRDKTAGMS